MSDYWQRVARQRWSRRAVLRAMAATAAAIPVAPLVGCSGGRSGVAGSASPTVAGAPDRPDVLNAAAPPRRGGRLVLSDAADFGSFDPHLGIALASAYFPRVYNVLVNQAPTKPDFLFFDLASSLEMPDPQTFVFKLRPDVVVGPNSLGVPERPLDADDVRISIERIKATPAANNYAFAHDYIESVTPASDTVTVKTTRPYAWFLNRIGLFVNTIAPRELLAGDLSRLAQHAAGAGPYRLVELQSSESATFDRNPNYYRKDEATGQRLPYVDGIDVRVLYDREALLTAFVSHQLDRYTPADAAEASSLADRFVIQKDPNFSFVAFAMDHTRPPFNDPRIRRAFSRAIDRRAYVDLIYGGDARPDGLVHWSVGAYSLDQNELETTYQPYDVGEARRLVEQAGGVKVKLTYPSSTLLEQHDKHLAVFLRQMDDAGIEIEQDAQDLSSWIESYSKVNYQCSLALNQLYETPEIPLGFHTVSGPLGDRSYVRGLGDPDIEAAARKANETLDLRERIQAVHDAQKVIYAKDPVFLPLVTPYDYQAYWRRVHDIPFGVGTTSYLLNTFWIES